MTATVTNHDVVAHTGLSLLLRLPTGIDPFNRVLADGPFTSGACTELGGTGVCSPGEQYLWSFGTLDPGQSTSVSIPPIVSAIADGTLDAALNAAPIEHLTGAPHSCQPRRRRLPPGT